MFENTRKVLDKFEKTFNECKTKFAPNKEEEDTLFYLHVNLAKALMKDEYINDESIAKIILAARNLSNEIIVKVQ